MIIPERKIEEVRSSVNVVDIIAEVVQLRKRGKNYIGLCPFHQEKTPSFTVSSEKQIFHCFGCHAGGNVFKFLMDYHNISFIEAVKSIAERVGINIEYHEAPPTEEQSEQEILYDINTIAARYFSNNLLQSLQGEIARSYFADRKIKVQSQRIFGLGYALPEWDHIVKHLKENNVDLEKAKYLGLIDKKDNGDYYDKFRGRIIFPIFSSNGRVIAFGGRIMEKAEAAKYLNSPESSIYFKRRSLYGLFHSKDEIRRLDKAILVEGYMDLISLFQHGIKNVVASSGTALTEEQVQMLSRYTKNVVVFYDADTAGIKASLRSIELLVRQDFYVKIAELPQGEDPDSFIHKSGKDEFDEYIKQAQNFLEYQTSQYEKQGKFEDPALQAEAIRELVHSVSFVNDELKRSILIKSVSKKFNLREKLLESELEKLLKSSSRFKDEKKPGNKEVTLAQTESLEKIAATKGNEINPVERDLIKLLFEGDKTIIDYIFKYINPEDFSNSTFKQVAEIVHDANLHEGSILPAILIEKITDDKVKNYVINLSFDKYILSKTWEEVHPGAPENIVLQKFAKDSVRSFRLNLIDTELESLHSRIISSKTESETEQLLGTKQRLIKEKGVVQKEE